MRRICPGLCVLLATVFACAGEPIQALRFEGLWKLNGPDPLNLRLDFKVAGDSVTATYFHPHPSLLSDIQIDHDRFTAWYLDEFAAKVNITCQLEGSGMKVTLAPPGRDPVTYPGLRIPPDLSRPATHGFSANVNTSGKTASGEFAAGGHSLVFSGGMDGNCVSASVGVDGHGSGFNGCLSVTKHKP